MRAVVQRVLSASVAVEEKVVGSCGKGLLVLAAAHRDDTLANAAKLADRVWGMRIFNDEEDKMNLSLRDLQAAGEAVGVLAVSNFTLFGDASQRRPSFVAAASFDAGKELFEAFVKDLKSLGCAVETGVFGAHMEISMVGDGPVTLIVDSGRTD